MSKKKESLYIFFLRIYLAQWGILVTSISIEMFGRNETPVRKIYKKQKLTLIQGDQFLL
jgi:hypothetical protein